MERNELITRLRPNKKLVSKRKRRNKKGGFLGALIGAVARTAVRALPKLARVLPRAIPKAIPKGSLARVGSIASKGVGRLGSVANMANLGLFGYSIYDQIQAKKEAQRLADEGDAQAAKDAAALDASIKEYEQAQRDYESKAASLQSQYSEQLDPNTLFNAISQMYSQSLQQPAAAATTTTTQPKRKKKGGFMGPLLSNVAAAAAESQKPQMTEAQFMTLIQKLAGDKGVDFINKQKEKKQQQQQQTPLQAASERLQAATRQEERMNEAFANRDKGSRGREQNPRSREARESERLRQATERAAAEVRALMPKRPKPKTDFLIPKPKLITGLPLEGSGVVGGFGLFSNYIPPTQLPPETLTPLQMAMARVEKANQELQMAIQRKEAFENKINRNSRGRDQNPRSRESQMMEQFRREIERAQTEAIAAQQQLEALKPKPVKPKNTICPGKGPRRRVLPQAVPSLEGSGVVGGAFRLSLPKMRVRRPTVLTRIAPKVSAIKGRLGALGNKAQLGSLVSIGFLGYSIQQMVEAKKQAEEAKAMGDAQAAKDAKALDDAIKQYKQSAKDVGTSATELESQYQSQVASQQDLLNALGSMFGVKK